MDFDIQSKNIGRNSDLLWLIQQCLDGDLHAVEGLFEVISPKYFQVANLFSPEVILLDEFAREGLIFLLWNLKEYEETENFDIWWMKKFFQYLREMRAESPVSRITIPGLAHLEDYQIDQYVLKESGLFYEEEITSTLSNSGKGNESSDDQEVDDGQKSIDPDNQTRAAIRAYCDQRKLEPDAENDVRFQKIAQEAGKIFLQRRENVRRRLVLFQLIWGLMGIVFLVGAFQFAGNIFTMGEPINNSVTISSESSTGTLIVFDPLATPTSTPRPYERTQANGSSYSPDISGDGRWIVYSSEAMNLVEGDTNGFADIFLYDRLNRDTVRISELPDGTQADGPSYGPSISPDGGWVAFVSFATNFVPEDKPDCAHTQSIPRPCADIYLLDLSTGNITLVSQIDGVPGNRDSGLSPQADIFAAKTAISDNGQFVAYFSTATNLGADPIHGGLFVFSQDTAQLFRVDITSNGSQVDGASYSPSFSADGNLLAFQSEATNLVPDDFNNQSDVFIYDVRSAIITRVTAGKTGTGAQGRSVMPDLSSEGKSVIFRSDAEGLVDVDSQHLDQIYIHDLVAGETQLISLDETGLAANGPSNLPSISGDGKTAAFISLAADLNTSLFNGTWNIFTSDLVSGEVQLLSRGLRGQAADGPSSFPRLSGDGLFVVFLSAATNLVPDDENGVVDIFLFQRESATIQRINIP